MRMTAPIVMRLTLLICPLLLALPQIASAQRIKPRVLLIFDTSGSMGVDVATGNPTGGDNSREYPGDGGSSRLFVAKEAVSSLVEIQSEVEFALMRYPQLEGPGINRGLIDGRQNNGYVGLAENPLNYAGECSGVLRAAGADEASALLTPFAPDNERDLIEWMNHQEDYPGDKELRAEGPTPIAESLRLAEAYLTEVGVEDLGAARCRRTAVVLLTDGGESCVPFADREDALVERAAALRGLSFRAGGEEIEQDVRTFVLAYAVNQRARDELGALARAGGTAIGRNGELDLVAGDPYEAEDAESLRAAFNAIIREAIPTEVCNGEDDDCDGRVDEGVLNACGGCGEPPVEDCDGEDDDCDGRVDEGALNACGECGEPPAEICNDIDDDCDGRVDEEVANACGGCANVQEEICNGRDDDCDGVADNRPGTDRPLTRLCSRDQGACVEGLESCIDGDWRDCDGILPVDETCDGTDDDCDGFVDEDTVPCGPAVDIGDVGECRVGARRCDPAACVADPAQCGEDGWLAACEDANGPVEETCNGRDDDCDGTIDEGLINACGGCGPAPLEACNGLDDNCDGRIDDNAQCPGGFLCFAGECVQSCGAAGECNPGFVCLAAWPGARYCHPNPCAAAYCPPGTRCDEAIGACADPCEGVECGEGEGCDLGECVPATCRHTGCPEGERCADDACGPDPCAGVECAEGFCRDGECRAACERVTCGPDSRCVDGLCAGDACGGTCLRGTICDPADGACVADPCADRACPAGTACVEGECRGDAPCAAISCPAGTACVDGTCTDFTPGVDPRFTPRPDMGAPDAEVEVDMMLPLDQGLTPDAGEPPATPRPDDCAQGPDGSSGAPWLLLLLVALWSLGRRREGLR